MPALRWSVEEIETCKKILSKHSQVKDAAEEITRTLGRFVSVSALKHAFLSRGEKAPSWYLNRAPVVLEAERGPALQDLVRDIEETASRLELDVHAVTPRQVAQCTSSDREAFSRYGGFNKVRIDSFDESLKPDLGQKEGVTARVAYVRRLERSVGKRDYLTEAIQTAISDAFERAPVKLSTADYVAEKPAGKRLLTALISDTHLGLNVDPGEVPGNEFDWVIAARRFALLGVQISEWKPHHRDETELQVVLNGDIIAGRIHLDDCGVTRITEQIHGATSILVAFFDFLRKHFGKIRVLCLPGNHDRVMRDRQVSQRWDSHATSIYLAIKLAFRFDDGISFEIPKTGEGVYELPGGDLAFFTHGDVAPSISNVGKALNLKPMIEMSNRLNASGEFEKPVRVIGYGHWHVPMILGTGISTIVVNGSLIGPDSFARYGVGVRGNQGAPAQLLFESMTGFPFGDSRFVHLRPADNEESLDLIIPTPSFDPL